MLEWILKPTSETRLQQNAQRSPAAAEQYNERQRRLSYGSLPVHPDRICLIPGKANRILLQGCWPEFSAPEAPNVRSLVTEHILKQTCTDRPVVLVHSQKHTPLIMYISRLCHGHDIRSDASPQGYSLLDGIPAEVLLNSFLPLEDSRQGSEILLFLSQVLAYLQSEGGSLTPGRIKQLVCSPASAAQFYGPAPCNGEIDPFSQSPGLRELLMRKLDTLSREQSNTPSTPGGRSVYTAVSAGHSVSVHCSRSMFLTGSLVREQLRTLAQEQYPFTLVLDQPYGAEWLELLDQLSEDIRVIFRTDDLPKLLHQKTDAFRHALSQFDYILLTDLQQTVSAQLWSEWFGTFDSIQVQRSTNSGMHFHGLMPSPYQGKSVNMVVQPRTERISAARLQQLLCSGDNTLLTSDGCNICLYR